ncbi:MAG: hypothetical protein QY331_00735 [Melioribacteraceae bacterium]|nr:hypothetical protein [Melioribacteraceae bacterium]WKZ69774.1 MAG: hypothetical protein QY331_00735 [Melioribacteraceae bacterium]
MNKTNKLLVFVLFLTLIFAACSSDDDSNPTKPEDPASVGTYSGKNSMDTTMTITISNVDGKAFVTSYEIHYSVQTGSGTASGTFSRSISSGMAEVVNSSFQYSLGTEVDEVLTGTINGNNIAGSFKFPPTPFAGVVSGTYTISK